jgi:ubiquitin carboxyl-terminal hydrolase 7
MRGTPAEGTYMHLFEGEMESYIRCKEVEYESTRVEKFIEV